MAEPQGATLSDETRTTAAEPQAIGLAEIREVAELVLRGSSLYAASRNLGLSPFEVQHALRTQAEVAAFWSDVEALMVGNVEAALYQTAMKGKTPAQVAWLQARGGQRWSHVASDDLLKGMSDEQLMEEAEKLGVPVDDLLPAELTGDGNAE